MDKPPSLPPYRSQVPPVIAPPLLCEVETPIVLKVRKIRKLSIVPWPIWVILCVTLPAIVIFGSAAIGIAGAFGAFGLPILLPAFLVGLAIVGLITVTASLRRPSNGVNYLVPIIKRIAEDEAARRMRKEMREAMTAAPIEPCKQRVSGNAHEAAQRLLRMNALEFERHVMAFFQDVGLLAWVTKQSNDMGVDGFAKHPDGLIVVQCKRYGPETCIGRPVIQQFKGVVEENDAWRGYVVTTSHFSSGACESADKNEKLHLVDMQKLIEWHERGFRL